MKKKNQEKKDPLKNPHIKKTHQIYKTKERLKLYMRNLKYGVISLHRWFLHNPWDFIQMFHQFQRHSFLQDITLHMGRNQQ